MAFGNTMRHIPATRPVVFHARLIIGVLLLLVVAIALTPAVYAVHTFVVKVMKIEPEPHEPKVPAPEVVPARLM